MALKYRLILENNCYLVEIDHSNYLIDTISRNSYFINSYQKILKIDNNEYSIWKNKKDINKIKTIEQCFKNKVNGVIGMDILFNTGFTINKEEMTFSFRFQSFEKNDFSTTQDMMYNIIPVTIDNKKGSLYLSTINNYCTMLKDFLENDVPSVDNIYDKNIYIGNKCYNVKTIQALKKTESETNINNQFSNNCEKYIIEEDYLKNTASAILSINNMFNKYISFDYNKSILCFE